MPSRRKFLEQAALGSAAALSTLTSGCESPGSMDKKIAASAVGYNEPLVLSTWKFGQKANAKALEVLNNGGSALDAVEQGVRIIEADGSNTSVGYGGLPDREGKVTLDACIMGPTGDCGSVCALEDIMHPITVARMVMEKTPHVMLVGEGAQAFALEHGMKKEKMLTEKAKKEWEQWKVDSNYQPIINVENHDTIGLIAIDKDGEMAGACTTSGLAFKMRGRVGDSPIIGAGLYVDNEIGAAAATGLGEAVLRTLGSFLIVELMRQGLSPEEACKAAVMRIVEKHKNYKDFQIGFIALNKAGQYGGYCLQKGFTYVRTTQSETKEEKPNFFLKD